MLKMDEIIPLEWKNKKWEKQGDYFLIDILLSKEKKNFSRNWEEWRTLEFIEFLGNFSGNLKAGVWSTDIICFDFTFFDHLCDGVLQFFRRFLLT